MYYLTIYYVLFNVSYLSMVGGPATNLDENPEGVILLRIGCNPIIDNATTFYSAVGAI